MSTLEEIKQKYETSNDSSRTRIVVFSPEDITCDKNAFLVFSIPNRLLNTLIELKENDIKWCPSVDFDAATHVEVYTFEHDIDTGELSLIGDLTNYNEYLEGGFKLNNGTESISLNNSNDIWSSSLDECTVKFLDGSYFSIVAENNYREYYFDFTIDLDDFKKKVEVEKPDQDNNMEMK